MPCTPFSVTAQANHNHCAWPPACARTLHRAVGGGIGLLGEREAKASFGAARTPLETQLKAKYQMYSASNRATGYLRSMTKIQLRAELKRLHDIITSHVRLGVEVTLTVSATEPEELVRHVLAKAVSTRAPRSAAKRGAIIRRKTHLNFDRP